MSKQPFMELAVEPERYEFFEDGGFLGELDRRAFFRIAGTGLVIALLAPGEVDAQRSSGGRGRFRPRGPQEIGAWLHVGADGKVTAYAGKVELGQNIRTSLTQAVAEELRTPLERVRVVLADTALVPYDMGTFGSQTTPQMNSQLRRAAAAARELLLDLAARQAGVPRDRLTVRDGQVVETRTKRTFAFGDLTGGKKLMKVIGPDAPTTPPADWKVAGTPVPKVDGRAFVTGGHKYASDINRPGMLHGKVLRKPSFGAELVSVDIRAAKALPGVTVIHDGDVIAVAAPTEQEAVRALAAIKAEWKTKPQPSGAELFSYLKDHPLSRGGGFGGRGFGGRGGGNRGSVPQGLKAADHKLKATYTVAYIAHAPLETRSAVAEWQDGKLTVWTGVQRPFPVRDEVARRLKVPSERVRLITPDTGSGYGGKHTGEAAIEAALLARAAGKPVKVAWTREEEFTWAYFRPAGVLEVNAGVTKDGKLTAWEFHNYNSGGAGLGTPYEVPNQLVAFHAADSPLRQGSYRVLAATANCFARETHMDELAHLAGLDPLAFRLKNLTNDRLKAVFEAAAKQFGWGKKPPAGHGYGIAGGIEKNGFVATCAEVAVDQRGGRVRVVRAVTAFDCGAVVNPDGLKNQIEGAVVMGLGGALFEAIEFADGKILNPKFSKYRVPRFADAPRLEVVLMDRKDIPPAGAGEAPLMAIAPAVGNAIFQASGVRLRSLPLVPRGLKAPEKKG